MPEQVQDFYPTPGTLSTCMWYTGLDPRTMKPVYVPKTPHDKALQRALMQWRKPQNRALVLEALRRTGRTDLIGYGKECRVRPDRGPAASGGKKPPAKGKEPAKTEKKPEKFVRKTGWAKPKPKKRNGKK